jgi:hypothetical protein
MTMLLSVPRAGGDEPARIAFTWVDTPCSPRRRGSTVYDHIHQPRRRTAIDIACHHGLAGHPFMIESTSALVRAIRMPVAGSIRQYAGWAGFDRP